MLRSLVLSKKIKYFFHHWGHFVHDKHINPCDVLSWTVFALSFPFAKPCGRVFERRFSKRAKRPEWLFVAIETYKCLLLLSLGTPTIVFYDKSTFTVHFVYLLQMYTTCSFLSFSTNLLQQENHKKNMKYFENGPLREDKKVLFLLFAA